MLFSSRPHFVGQKPTHRKFDNKYYLIKKRELTIEAPYPFPSKFYRKLITDHREDNRENWKAIIKILKTDQDFKNWYDSAGGYINAVYIKDYDSLDHKADREYSPLDEGLHSVTKLSINYKYVETKIDMSANTFLEAIVNKNYIRDECWINTIVDFYGDNIISDKKRNRVTRETILQDIGMSEEDIQNNGISVNNIVPFFSKHNLQLKVFDVYGKCIFKYNPPVRNHHNKIAYCMVKGDHVYTLNHD